MEARLQDWPVATRGRDVSGRKICVHCVVCAVCVYAHVSMWYVHVQVSVCVCVPLSEKLNQN